MSQAEIRQRSPFFHHENPRTNVPARAHAQKVDFQVEFSVEHYVVCFFCIFSFSNRKFGTSLEHNHQSIHHTLSDYLLFCGVLRWQRVLR